MKNFFILLLIIAVVWLAWLHFSRTDVVRTEEKIVAVETRVGTEEKYGRQLRAIADSTFAPLDTTSPNPVSELTKLAATARTDARNGLLTEWEAELVIGLCTQLKLMNNERERFEVEYRGILNRRFDSFDGRFGEERKREQFATAHLRRWQECTQKYRAPIARNLDQLRRAERQKEIDQRAAFASPSAAPLRTEGTAR